MAAEGTRLPYTQVGYRGLMHGSCRQGRGRGRQASQGSSQLQVRESTQGRRPQRELFYGHGGCDENQGQRVRSGPYKGLGWEET